MVEIESKNDLIALLKHLGMVGPVCQVGYDHAHAQALAHAPILVIIDDWSESSLSHVRTYAKTQPEVIYPVEATINNAIPLIPDEYLSLVYFTKPMNINIWLPKLRKGGIIAGCDQIKPEGSHYIPEDGGFWWQSPK